LVNESLSQLHGGLLDQLAEAETAGKERKLGGKLGVPGTPISREVSEGSHVPPVRRASSQTLESAFQTVYDVLENAGEIRPLDEMNSMTRFGTG